MNPQQPLSLFPPHETNQTNSQQSTTIQPTMIEMHASTYETQIISQPIHPTTLPCQVQSKPINPKTHDPTQLQSGNQFGYPITNYGVPLEYYQQNPPPLAGQFERLFQPIPDQKGIQITQSDEGQTFLITAMVCCCPCATGYVFCSSCCCKGGTHSIGHTSSPSCDTCDRCCDCSGACDTAASFIVLIIMAIIAILILTALVSIPIILLALPFYLLWKLYTLKSVKILLNEERREIIVTTRGKYFKKDEILSETIIPFHNILEISVVELDKKHFIVAKCKGDTKINFTQFITDISEKELQKGVQFLKNYFSLHGVAAFQTAELP
ncbi:predicted protein [Naegleria gruberi]|uniref:Predicted protein n=1 Tax=Naegleria gruberi TaxID=5762 RepID=D2VST0_NAEGR|nr:uncharacterized protein NAEGRDRAFT_72049 [Naegleria gruberi]EFC40172.1 predicted protein [Naegleria gruberi]|eukprot:XP_002672916.1 predicted protein [Naegleria gruberi strain NEG-M]